MIWMDLLLPSKLSTSNTSNTFVLVRCICHLVFVLSVDRQMQTTQQGNLLMLLGCLPLCRSKNIRFAKLTKTFKPLQIDFGLLCDDSSGENVAIFGQKVINQAAE